MTIYKIDRGQKTTQHVCTQWEKELGVLLRGLPRGRLLKDLLEATTMRHLELSRQWVVGGPRSIESRRILVHQVRVLCPTCSSKVLHLQFQKK